MTLSNGTITLQSAFPLSQTYVVGSSQAGLPANGTVTVGPNGVATVSAAGINAGAAIRARRVTDGAGDGVTGAVVVLQGTKPGGVGRLATGMGSTAIAVAGAVGLMLL